MMYILPGIDLIPHLFLFWIFSKDMLRLFFFFFLMESLFMCFLCICSFFTEQRLNYYIRVHRVMYDAIKKHILMELQGSLREAEGIQ